MLERECRRRNVSPTDIIKPENYQPILEKYGFQSLDDIYSAVGYGGMASVYAVGRMIDEAKAHAPVVMPPVTAAPQRPQNAHSNNGIIMVDNPTMDVPVRFARCCSPVPGDDIVGFITRGRGVTIHKTECPNIQGGEDERKVAVMWAGGATQSFCAAIKIVGTDHVGMLAEIASFIATLNVPIRNITSNADRNHIATLRLVL